MLLLFCKISINKCSHDHANSLSIIGGQLITNENNNKIDKLLNVIKSKHKERQIKFQIKFM